MNKNEKELIYNKFKQDKERDTLTNQGIEIPFGNIKVKIKALSWKKSNEFEDELKKVILKFKDFSGLDTSKDLEKVMTSLLCLLRDDVIILANKATSGFITLEKIESTGATKNDVIRVIIEFFNINYQYAKNLITQLRNL